MKIYSESLNSEQTLDPTTLIYCFIVISFVFDEQKKKNSQGFRFLKKICTEEATLSINYKKKKKKNVIGSTLLILLSQILVPGSIPLSLHFVH